MNQLTPEEREVGKENFYTALGAFDQSPAAEQYKRRDFLKGVIGVGATAGLTTGCKYFGYTPIGDPLRVAIIGTGDEGSVLIGALNPDYIKVVSICDIRPFNIHRAFHGDWASDAAVAARPGLMTKYGYADEKAARKEIKVETDYKKVLDDPNVEGIIIALPLFLHAPVAIDALKAGKHVLTEKLMAHNVAQCKLMGRLAKNENKVLTVGHQRHYSVLYDNAVNLIKWGLLGEMHHIRAQWHRGNLPGNDSWQQPLPFDVEAVIDGKKTKINMVESKLKELKTRRDREKDPVRARLLDRQVAQWAAWAEDKKVEAAKYGYQDFTMSDGRTRSALEELCRWRLFKRTGGGLMAELGSHQLDASSIFVSALRNDGKKAHPLSVHAVGGRHTFPMDRHAEDHVYCTFEFPGPGYEPGYKAGYFDPEMNYPDPKKGIPSYDQDPNKRIVVTYSSIMGNGWGGYGETVMGSKGTLILDREQEVLLFKESDTSTKIGVKDDKGGATLDTQASGKGPSIARAAAESGPVSRGYTEEIEHWAWCIRNNAPEAPRCRAEVALGDAVIALASNVAIDASINGKSGYVRFEEGWYDIDHDSTPDGSSLKEENEKLGAGLS
jgi:predicted dehydrogenase